MTTTTTMPDCPIAISLHQLEDDEETIIVEPDDMTPAFRALVAEARAALGHGATCNVDAHTPDLARPCLSALRLPHVDEADPQIPTSTPPTGRM